MGEISGEIFQGQNNLNLSWKVKFITNRIKEG